MDYFSKLWNFSNANQASNFAIPIGKQDDKCFQDKKRKPDAYKSINSSQIRIITSNNLSNNSQFK